MEGLIATEQSARKFAAWIDDNHPEEVDLAARNVNDEIVRILSKSLRRDKKLRQLSLCNNRITSGSCSIVADILRNNSNVTSLNLLYNSICSTASGNYDSQSFIHEFVETCNEMQNIRSVCGCSSFNNELVLASDDDKELSNVLLLGIDLRLDTDLISLRYRGSLGLSEIFESLRDNRSLVRGTFSCIQSGSGEFDLALITFLEHNLSAKTLQFAFTAIDQTDKSTISSAVESEAEFAKSIMLCIVRSMEKNLGVTCLQLDSWPRDRETLTGLVSMLRKNCTLLHLALFSSVLRTSDLEAIAGALEYNTTLRVLYINDRSCREHNNSGGRAPSGESSGSSSSSGGSVGKYLLTADVVYLLEAAAKKRKVPFIIRTESKDFVFGSTRLMVAPPAVQWEVEDKVEYHADEEVWQPATVIAVYPDQRYSIKLDDSNTVRLHCRAQLLRAGTGFERCNCIPEVPSMISPSSLVDPCVFNNGTAASTTSASTAPKPQANRHQAPSTSRPAPSDAADNRTATSRRHFPVVYVPDQAVEVRYLGDSRWIPGQVVQADGRVPSEVVTVRMSLSLDIAEAAKEGDAKAAVEQIVQEETAFEACFVRPSLPSPAAPVIARRTNAHAAVPSSTNSQHFLTHSSAYYQHQELHPGKAFYDSGAYQRGDYVEVRMLTGNTYDDVPEVVWKRGRLATDRKNGTYDVRMETGVDIGAVRGCHLRYHFRPRNVVDCRSAHSGLPNTRTGGDPAESQESPGAAATPSPDERDPESDGNHKHQHRLLPHKKHHRHHHLQHAKHFAGEAGGRHNDSVGGLEHLPPPHPCTWAAALVLKQEKTGAYVVSFDNALKEKGVSVSRLMPTNRAHVRAAANDMRVVSQSWCAQEDFDTGGDSVDLNNAEGTPREVKRRSISLDEPLDVNVLIETADEALSNFLPTELEVIGETLKLKQQSPSPLISSVPPTPRNTTVAASLSTPPTPRSTTVAAAFAPAPSTPRNTAVATFVSAPQTPRNTTVATAFASTAPTPRPLISAFDINDRIEVSQGYLDGESIWVAGRVEAIHPDNCTYFVRYVDGGADQAVSGKRMRKASLATPARNGARLVDKSAPAPAPTFDLFQEEDAPLATAENHLALFAPADSVTPAPVDDTHTPEPEQEGPMTPISAVQSTTPISDPSAVQTATAAPLEPPPHSSGAHAPHHGKHHSHGGRKKSASSSDPSTTAKPAASPALSANQHETVGHDSAGTKSPSKQVEVISTESRQDALLPPLRSPEPRAPNPAAPQPPVVLTVGAWLSIFNSSTKCYEPCMVECVYENGVFDACNKRGELYRRIDERYIEPKPGANVLEVKETATHATAVQDTSAAHVPKTTPPHVEMADGAYTHHGSGHHGSIQADHSIVASLHSAAVSRSSQRSSVTKGHTASVVHHSRSHHKHSAAKANKNHKLAIYKVGAKVEACVDPPEGDDEPAWEHAIIVKKLSPEIYTVYLEEAGEELTLVTAKIRHRGAVVDHSFDADRSIHKPHHPHQHGISSSSGNYRQGEKKLEEKPEERPEVSSSEEGPFLRSAPRHHPQQNNQSLPNASKYALYGGDDVADDATGGIMSMRDAMNPTSENGYGFVDLIAEGSLDGSLDDDELVVVGTPLLPLSSLALLDSNGSLAGLDSDLRGPADSDGRDGLPLSQQNVFSSSRRPVTAPIQQPRASAGRASERSISAHRNDKPGQHQHRHRRPAHGAPTESVLESGIITPRKPVSIGAGIDPSGESSLFAVHKLNHIVSHDDAAPPVAEVRAGVCHRTHAAPQHWGPLVAFAELPSAIAAAELSPLTDWTVVAFSEFANFRNCRGGSYSSLSWGKSTLSDERDNAPQHCQSSAVLSMCVHEDAPDVCPVKVTFFVEAIIIAEVHFQVCTTVATLPPSAAHSRTSSGYGESQDFARIRQYAVEAQASWSCVKSNVYRHIHVLSCEVPTDTGADAVEVALNLTKHVLDKSLAALPSFVAAQVHQVSELSSGSALRNDVLRADKVQVVCIAADKASLNREKWSAMMRANVELMGVVKSLCAASTNGSIEGRESQRLTITSVDANAGDAGAIDADWMYSVGLTPYHLHAATTVSDNPLATQQWVYYSDFHHHHAQPPPSAPSSDSISLRHRYLSSLRALAQSLTDLQALTSHEIPLGLLLLPPQVELLPLSSGHTARTASAGQRHKKGRSPQSESSVTESTGTGQRRWNLVVFCDSMDDPAASSCIFSSAGSAFAVSIPVEITAQLVFDLSPLLKCSVALLLAQKMAVDLDAPFCAPLLPFATLLIAPRLEVGQLEKLFALYCEQESSFLASRFGPVPAALTLNSPARLQSFSPQQQQNSKPARSDASTSAPLSIECAVSYLERSLLSVHQRDLTQCTSALKEILSSRDSNAGSCVQVVKLQLGETVHWINPRNELHDSWRALVELARPVGGPRSNGDIASSSVSSPLLNTRELHLRLQDLEAAAAATGPFSLSLPLADSPMRGAISRTDGASSLLQGLSQGSPSTAKRELQSHLAQVIMQEVGVKDAFSAQEAAACLVAMGCASYIDFVSIGTVFATADGRIEVEKLRVFLHEGGIPLFIAAKLAVFVQNKLNH